MKPALARQAAFGALIAIDRGAWSAEALAAKSLHLEPRDAALASDIVFGTLRHRGEIHALLGQYSKRPADKLDPAVRIALEMAIYQLRFLDRVPDHAAVNDAVELVRRAGKTSATAFVNAILRRAIREPVPVPDTLSTPPWLLKRWIAQYGEATAIEIARASLQPPERYIRVGNATPPAAAEPTAVPGCYLLATGDPTPFRFQDIGSQAVVPLLNLSTRPDVSRSLRSSRKQDRAGSGNTAQCHRLRSASEPHQTPPTAGHPGRHPRRRLPQRRFPSPGNSTASWSTPPVPAPARWRATRKSNGA